MKGKNNVRIWGCEIRSASSRKMRSPLSREIDFSSLVPFSLSSRWWWNTSLFDWNSNVEGAPFFLASYWVEESKVVEIIGLNAWLFLFVDLFVIFFLVIYFVCFLPLFLSINVCCIFVVVLLQFVVAWGVCCIWLFVVCFSVSLTITFKLKLIVSSLDL